MGAGFGDGKKTTGAREEAQPKSFSDETAAGLTQKLLALPQSDDGLKLGDIHTEGGTFSAKELAEQIEGDPAERADVEAIFQSGLDALRLAKIPPEDDEKSRND